MKDYEEEITLEEMSYELDIMMQAMLFYAGVKREKIEAATDLYIEMIDDVLEKNQKASGMDEVLAVIEELKKRHKELFVK